MQQYQFQVLNPWFSEVNVLSWNFEMERLSFVLCWYLAMDIDILNVSGLSWNISTDTVCWKMELGITFGNLNIKKLTTLLFYSKYMHPQPLSVIWNLKGNKPDNVLVIIHNFKKIHASVIKDPRDERNYADLMCSLHVTVNEYWAISICPNSFDYPWVE